MSENHHPLCPLSDNPNLTPRNPHATSAEGITITCDCDRITEIENYRDEQWRETVEHIHQTGYDKGAAEATLEAERRVSLLLSENNIISLQYKNLILDTVRGLPPLEPAPVEHFHFTGNELETVTPPHNVREIANGDMASETSRDEH